MREMRRATWGNRLVSSHSCCSDVRGLTMLRPEAQNEESTPCLPRAWLMGGAYKCQPPCRGTLYSNLETAAGFGVTEPLGKGLAGWLGRCSAS
jgi:hypothetical protein